MKYLDPQLRELCNAIVLSAITDYRYNRMTRLQLYAWLRSDWGMQLLRGSTTPEAIMKVLP